LRIRGPRSGSVVVRASVWRRKNDVKPIAVLVDSGGSAWLQFERDNQTVTRLLHLNIFKAIGAETRRRRTKIRQWNLDVETIASSESFVVEQRCV
jgi:hypothetical protein